MKLVSRLLTGVVGLSMLVVVSGCAETTGAAVGAGAGAAIGAGTGYGAGKGALIGAGTGAVAGGIYDIVKHR
ncbi:MAG TPA: YMGG-like glycine zipper-containing protein [Methylomirabilota bacterium]|nr:YMGG-like glycine zipper-containing protein [Methylomirabilota bacterium]